MGQAGLRCAHTWSKMSPLGHWVRRVFLTLFCQCSVWVGLSHCTGVIGTNGPLQASVFPPAKLQVVSVLKMIRDRNLQQAWVLGVAS